MNGQERCRAAAQQSAVAYLKMKRGSGRFVLWVEGPDDCVVLQRFAAPACDVRELSGKDYVGSAVRAANAARLSGFIGRVDRDFDDSKSEVMPARVAVISRRFTDLEASMLALNAHDVIADFVRREHRDSLPWLMPSDGLGALDMLASSIVAPIGALRKTWTGQRQSLDHLAHPVEVLMELMAPRQVPLPVDLARVLAKSGGLTGPDADRIASDAHRVYTSSDPWKLVRGKDMVRALAVVLSQAPRGMCYYDSWDEVRIERELKGKVGTLFSYEILRSAGTVEELAAVLAPVGESIDLYLARE